MLNINAIWSESIKSYLKPFTIYIQFKAEESQSASSYVNTWNTQATEYSTHRSLLKIGFLTESDIVVAQGYTKKLGCLKHAHMRNPGQLYRWEKPWGNFGILFAYSRATRYVDFIRFCGTHPLKFCLDSECEWHLPSSCYTLKCHVPFLAGNIALKKVPLNRSCFVLAAASYLLNCCFWTKTC